MLLRQLRCRGEDFAGYVYVEQAWFVAYFARFACNICSYYASKYDMKSELGSREASGFNSRNHRYNK